MRGEPPPRFFIVTDRHATGGRPLTEAVDGALSAVAATVRAAGRTLDVGLQLRDKDLPATERYRLGLLLRDISRAHGARFYVNDHVDLALALGADGVQLGRASLPTKLVRGIGPNLEVGFSAHCANEIERVGSDCDFVFLGPIFLTPKKDRIIGPKALHLMTWKIENDTPIVAIGGINASNIDSLNGCNIYGCACIRAGLNEAAAIAVVKRLIHMFPTRK